jgi:hypothetical protein
MDEWPYRLLALSGFYDRLAGLVDGTVPVPPLEDLG